MSGDLRCEPLSIEQLRSLPPIVSEYTSDEIFRVDLIERADCVTWTLRAQRLTEPVRKVYDIGRIDHILSSYSDVKEENLHCLGAFVGDEYVGLAIWTETSWNNSLWLMDIRTRRENRGRGIGRALLDYVAAVARDDGWRGILVETQNNNYAAIRFYRRYGFQFSGLNHNLYSNDDLDRQDVAIYLYYSINGE
ncbi:MAG TPA: GNAT family N-acetyltransferase [Chloroflexota bacterium]|nr:GNAT family N-acetyltransferase [Chloroflexota bacterium]